MDSLREELMRMRIALSTAKKELNRAQVRLNSGTFTFRMYLEFESRVKYIERIIVAIEVDIMS